MIKQSTTSRQAVIEFQRELGKQLFLCRTEKKLFLKQVAKETGWEVDFIERMELGQIPLKRLWKVLRLFRFYGKDIHISIKDSSKENT